MSEGSVPSSQKAERGGRRSDLVRNGEFSERTWRKTTGQKLKMSTFKKNSRLVGGGGELRCDRSKGSENGKKWKKKKVTRGNGWATEQAGGGEKKRCWGETSTKKRKVHGSWHNLGGDGALNDVPRKEEGCITETTEPQENQGERSGFAGGGSGKDKKGHVKKNAHQIGT